MDNRTKPKKERQPGSSTTGEKIFFALGDMGCNFIWTFTSGFLTLYYTDSVMLSAAFVGTLMFVTRFLDGISDIAMGIVIEKTQTRWGKARPWLLFASAPLAISLILLFNVPSSIGENGKHIYVLLTYIFLAVIAYTAVNLAYNTMIPRFSLNPDDRNVVSAVRGGMVVVAALVISVVTPGLIDSFGGQSSQRAWTAISAIYASLALILLLVTFFGVKERIPPTVDEEGKPQKTPIKKALAVLLRNKYFYIATALFVLFYANTGLGGVTIYYVRDILGNATLFGLVTVAGVLPMLLALPVMPLLYKKFGKRNMMLLGSVIGIVGCVIQFIAPATLIVYLAGCIVRGFGGIMFSASIFTLASDIVEFTEWKHEIRAEGLVTSVNSFGLKLGTGVGAGLVGWVLAIGRYDASLAVQAQPALNAMIALQIGIPLILCVAQTVLLIFWDLEKLRPQIEKELERRRVQDVKQI
jgi:GPH family glycoside/pentoside/hexuronide:cation symporter